MLDAQLQGPSADGPAKRPHALSKEVTPLSREDEAFLRELDRKNEQFLDYAEYVLNHSKTSIRVYKYAYRIFRRFLLDPSHGKMELRARVHLLDGFIAWSRKRGTAPITINSYWRSLRPFFNYLERTDSFQNPYHGAKPPKFQAPLPKALRGEELVRLLDTARHYPWTTSYQRARAVAILGVMIFAGLRRNEVLKLKFGDVNLQEGMLRIERGKGRFGGKDRTAYFNTDLREILSEFIIERQRQKFTCPEFFATRANRGISLEQFKRLMLIIKRASGIKFTPHALRHSFITMLIRSGVPINVVQELAGHANITTTAGYMRLWDDDKKKQINRLRLD
jgi:site-specific recombinase XerD